MRTVMDFEAAWKAARADERQREFTYENRDGSREIMGILEEFWTDNLAGEVYEGEAPYGLMTTLCVDGYHIPIVCFEEVSS